MPGDERPFLPCVEYLPPARRGDLQRAAASFEMVLLIDGFFDQSLAVSPKETYQACQSTRFFGAASMGALRAVECAPHGATPLGAIAGWYLAGKIDGDDEVAVVVDPVDHRALTVPLVNVRYVAGAAVKRGVLDGVEATRWIARTREIFYADRSWENAIGEAPAHARSQVQEL